MTDLTMNVQTVGSRPIEPTVPEERRQPETRPVESDGLSFSKHLNDRIHRRNIRFDGETMTRLSSAIDRAADKGARDSVVLLDDLAVLVNVSNRTVLTAIDTGRMRDGVFTNIDSVVVG